MLFARIFRPVDDPQIFPAAAFHGRLHQIAAAALDERERLDHHTFSAGAGQFFPPLCGFALAVRA
jgi:hypothetical protein